MLALTVLSAGCRGRSSAAPGQTEWARLPQPAPMPLDTQPADVAGEPDEKEFAELLQQRPQAVPLTLPLNAKPPVPRPLLPPARSRVVERLAQLERSGRSGWCVLRFLDATPDEPYPLRYVLFSQYLEQIEELANQFPPVRVRVSGETTIYKRWAFLLLTSPPILVATAGEPEGPKPLEALAPPETATAPAVVNAAASAEAVGKVLLKNAPDRPIPVPPKAQPSALAPVASVAPVPRDRGQGRYGPPEVVADRLIRVVPERKDGWLEARFESDNTLQQPPLRLLPCEQLEEAERVALGAKVRMMQFRVSGRITQYKGRRYLLLNKLVRVRDMDQF